MRGQAKPGDGPIEDLERMQQHNSEIQEHRRLHKRNAKIPTPAFSLNRKGVLAENHGLPLGSNEVSLFKSR